MEKLLEVSLQYVTFLLTPKTIEGFDVTDFQELSWLFINLLKQIKHRLSHTDKGEEASEHEHCHILYFIKKKTSNCLICIINGPNSKDIYFKLKQRKPLNAHTVHCTIMLKQCVKN